MKFNRLTLLETAILGALTSKPRYGREIVAVVRDLTGGDAELSEKSLYTTLNRMVDKELIERLEQTDKGRRPHYGLTPFGAQTFRQTQALMLSLAEIPPAKGSRLRTVVWRHPKHGGHDALRQVSPVDEEEG